MIGKMPLVMQQASQSVQGILPPTATITLSPR
jgi:hypothetical protein